MKGNTIGLWNVRSDEKDIKAILSGYSEFSFNNKGNPSLDGSMVVVNALNARGEKVFFAYDLDANKKYPDIEVVSSGFSYATISPLGNYIVRWGFLGSDGRNDHAQVYDLNGSKVGPFWSEYHRPGHFDLAVDENGDEVAVGNSKSKPDSGRVIKRRLRDGQVTVLTPGGYATHTSTRNLQNPGWAYATYSRSNDSWHPYHSEIVAVKLDGSMVVRRLVHTHAEPNGYVTESHGSVSPDGTKVIFSSNWDERNGNIAAYVVEICQ